VVKTEDREISDCYSVNIYGVGHLKVRKGERTALKVKAEDNMLQYVKSDVRNGMLKIGVGGGTYTWHGFPEMELTVKELKAVTLSGQTQVTAEDVNVPELNVETDGQCTVILSGKAQAQVFNLEGQCTCDARRLVGRTATVRSVRPNVQCRIILSAVEAVHGEIGGTSLVEYFGKPTVVDLKVRDEARVLERK